jgi:hypothetical protein
MTATIFLNNILTLYIQGLKDLSPRFLRTPFCVFNTQGNHGNIKRIYAQESSHCKLVKQMGFIMRYYSVEKWISYWMCSSIYCYSTVPKHISSHKYICTYIHRKKSWFFSLTGQTMVNFYIFFKKLLFLNQFFYNNDIWGRKILVFV